MSIKQSQMVEELANFARAAWFELPLMAARRMIGAADENSLAEAGWKAYDAWVKLANQAANELYSNQLVGDVTGRTIESALKVQRVGDAIASAFFGNLWPAIGLPTASDVRALRDEVMALREEARANADRGHKQVHDQHISSVHAATDDGLHVVRNGVPADTRRIAREGEQRAAA